MVMDIDRLSIGEAAKRLGLTTEAVRKRIRRGSIDAQKDGKGQWWVLVQPDVSSHGQDTSGRRPDAGEDMAGQVDLVSVLQQRICALEEERDYLRGVLADQTKTVQAMALRALPSPAPVSAEAVQTPIEVSPRPRRWWQFWATH